jgi:hypothetical protein
MDKLVEWLLEGPPWVQYRTRIDILGQPESNSEVVANRAESVWKAWSEWEFGQKKNPSFWVTLLAYRILERMSES